MEKFHLPILSQEINPFAEKIEKREGELPVEYKIAKAFLYQKYPLSESGLTLDQRLRVLVAKLKDDSTNREALAELTELKDQLPTVENPHLELFAELNIKDHESSEFFGINLVNLQVTKGCSKQCSHCALESSSKVEIMPYAAVLKVAEKMRENETRVRSAEQACDKKIEELLNDEDFIAFHNSISPERYSIEKIGFSREYYYAILKLWREGQHFRTKFKFSDYITRLRSEVVEVDALYNTLGMSDENVAHDGFKKDKDFFDDIKFPSITNYYDSDLFDYRDTSFLHADGTPADYGDVVKACASLDRKLHLTTAGWSLNDGVAQRAAEKIANIDSLLFNPRISINPYAKGSLDDPGAYKKRMENVLNTLAPVNPRVLFLSEPIEPGAAERTKDFVINAIMPLWNICRKKRLKSFGFADGRGKLSRFSGRAASVGQKPEDLDIGGCLWGYHIWPEGVIKKHTRDNKNERVLQDTGMSIYELKK